MTTDLAAAIARLRRTPGLQEAWDRKRDVLQDAGATPARHRPFPLPSSWVRRRLTLRSLSAGRPCRARAVGALQVMCSDSPSALEFIMTTLHTRPWAPFGPYPVVVKCTSATVLGSGRVLSTFSMRNTRRREMGVPY